MKPVYKKILDIEPWDWTPIIQPNPDEANIERYVYNGDSDFGIEPELIVFPRRIHNSAVFIRYPDEPYFTALPSGVWSSRSGNKRTGESVNPYSKYETKMQLFTCGDNALVVDFFDMWFLKRKYDLDGLDGVFYRELPDIYDLEYILDIKGLGYSHDYFVLARPVWNYEYHKLKAFFINTNGSQIECDKITNFRRYRDGGTTLFDVEYRESIDDFKKVRTASLFFDTPFKKRFEGKKRICKIDEQEVKLIEDDEDLKDELLSAIILKTKKDLDEKI